MSPTPSSLSNLLETLNLLLEQARAYERALPPNDYRARAAVAALSRLAERARDEATSLADENISQPKQPAHPFSPREFQVLLLAMDGLTNKEIGFRLGISERTVQFHLNSIFNKTATGSRTEAVAQALRNGWLTRCSRER
jgi:DNA-binding NarL/FixJ family response regulator